MKVIIIGYGYCAQHLLTYCNKDVHIYTRNWQHLSNASFLDLDDERQATIDGQDAIVFYTVPPQKKGCEDDRIKHFLAALKGKPRHLIYFGSSGVYGDQEGEWVDEQTEVKLENDRAYRRASAEKQCQNYGKQQDVAVSLLRIAGIYGPERLGMRKVFNQHSIIKHDQAPFCNYIHVEDLCAAAWHCSQQNQGCGIVNIADGHPQHFGAITRIIAQACNITLQEVSLLQIYKNASPQYRQFLSQSKRLNIAKLEQLGYTIQHHDLRQSIHALLQHNIKENFICVS